MKFSPTIFLSLLRIFYVKMATSHGGLLILDCDMAGKDATLILKEKKLQHIFQLAVIIPLAVPLAVGTYDSIQCSSV